MTWNWEQQGWPEFRYDPKPLEQLESTFLSCSGLILGSWRHLADSEKEELKINLISMEALSTSAIEGEVLNRASLQSSIRREFGLDSTRVAASPKEQGISEMMVHLYLHADAPVTEALLCNWHRLLFQGSHALAEVGSYRTHAEAMQVVSGSMDDQQIHFEAPPSSRVGKEMKHFITWFRNSSDLPALTRAGIAHLYFLSIHPFEDGNGRIGRALVEKAISESLGSPSLIALATQIEAERKRYYSELQAANHCLDIQAWLTYFAKEILQAQQRTDSRIRFLISKAKFLDQFRPQLNARQEKVILRVLREGPEGFSGGLSADNYIKISKTSRASATRDLSRLIQLGALRKSGELKGTRYWLNLPRID